MKKYSVVWKRRNYNLMTFWKKWEKKRENEIMKFYRIGATSSGEDAPVEKKKKKKFENGNSIL